MNDFKLTERKNVNIPGSKILLETITEKDEYDIINFAIKHDLDYVALSFARTKKCMQLFDDLVKNNR